MLRNLLLVIALATITLLVLLPENLRQFGDWLPL
jgi:hypothetical protein